MTWPLRRFLAPVLAGSIVCTGLLFGWTMVQDLRAPHLADTARVWPFMLLFEALGLVLLVPLASVIFKWSPSKLLRPFLFAVVGSVIGVVLILPISVARPTFPEILLPLACGAVSALIWLAFNREPFRG